MRKSRLPLGRNHLKWTHHLFVILALWITMGLARRSQQQSENFNPSNNNGGGGHVIVPMNSGRNALRDRLYYNPQPQYSFNSRKAPGHDLQPNFFLRTENESPINYPPVRRGTSTMESRLSSFPPSPFSSVPAHLDNTMSNKLLDAGVQNQFLPTPSQQSNGGRGNLFPPSVHGNSKKQRKKTYPSRSASVNSILRLDPDRSVWDEAAAVCRTIPGLTREQMELCFKNPDATKVALQGLSLAVDECAFQMSKNRWNCSSLQGRLNPHSTVLFKKGYREVSFGHAISAAGVAYSVAKACSQGNLLSCGCGFQYDDQVNFIPSKDADYAFDESNESSLKRWMGGGGGGGRNSISSWKWSGCSHNMDYGVKFAKLFLDARERSTDLPSRINLHNNRVGRTAVSTNMEVRCKCHGLSGSCELRTCWRSAPEFRQVGTVLKNKFRRAVMIDQSELGNRPLNRVQKLKKQRRKRRDRTKRNSGNIDLWYYERSPTYCESNSDHSIPGTTGRVCNRTGGREMGSCSTLCCGRGYNTIRQVYTTRCQCQFIWCCEVTCKNCTVDEYITVCK